jgi:co-chaperonin GroES (HSP10)
MIRPLFCNVLVKPIKEEDKAGIILTPDPTQPHKGEIIAVGGGEYIPTITPLAPGMSSFNVFPPFPMVVSVGNKVLFYQQKKQEVYIDNEKYYLVDQKELLGVIDE